MALRQQHKISIEVLQRAARRMDEAVREEREDDD
jgi:hypothetical protein